MGFLMVLARPGHAHRLSALQASANREATAGYRRALAELSQMQEAAEIAQHLADRKIEFSAAVISAEEEARAAAAGAKVAKAAADRAVDLYHAHLAMRPIGWRAFIAQATGAMARHNAQEEELRKAKIIAEGGEKERACESRAADRRVEQALEAHNRDATSLQKIRQQDADSAKRRSDEATRVLRFLEQKPVFAGMGVEALLRLGRRLLDRESASATNPAAVLKPKVELAPAYG